MREADLDYFRNLVAATRWRFAKTYVESYPHEHMLQQWVDADTFIAPKNPWSEMVRVNSRGARLDDTTTNGNGVGSTLTLKR